MAHLDLKLMSLSTEALADCSVHIQESSPTLWLPALLSWVKNRTLHSENIAKGGNLSFMGKKIDPVGMSERVSSCNNPMLSSHKKGGILYSHFLKSGRNSAPTLQNLWLNCLLSVLQKSELFLHSNSLKGLKDFFWFQWPLVRPGMCYENSRDCHCGFF